MARTNNPDNDGFYEQRVTEIRGAIKRGDIEGAAHLTVNTATESEFSGPDRDNDTYRSLSAAAKRLRDR